MKVKEIAALLEKSVPKELAYDWDNVGLLIGDENKEIHRVYLTLDVNMPAAAEACKRGADMIISHHPMFFKPIKRLTYSAPEGRLVSFLIKHDIPVYAAHTNMDTAACGINTVLAKKLGIENAKVIEPNGENTGLGRYGELKSPISLREFTEKTSAALGTPVRYEGDADMTVRRAAVGSGACAELAAPARDLGCDVLVTADMKYHQMLDAADMGIAVIDAGHYPTEVFVTDIFAELLKDTGLEIIKSENTDVFKYHMPDGYAE